MNDIILRNSLTIIFTFDSHFWLLMHKVPRGLFCDRGRDYVIYDFSHTNRELFLYEVLLIRIL